MGRQFFKNVDFSVTYPLKGVQVTFGDSFFVGQCEVFVCLGFGHFILFVYLFVCLGFGHFILFVYFFPWREAQKVQEWGVNSLKTSIFPLPTPLRGCRSLLEIVFLQDSVRCLSVLDLVILFYLFIFFLGREAQKVREWGVNSLKTSIFPLPTPLRGCRSLLEIVFLQDSVRCLSVLDLVILFYLFIFFLGREAQKVREWGVNSLKTSIFPLPTPLRGCRSLLEIVFLQDSVRCLSVLDFVILFVYFFPWPRSSKGPRKGCQFFKNVDFSVTYPLKGVQVTFGDSFFVGQCEVFVCLGFAHFILFVYFFPWPRSSKGPRMWRQFFKNVDFSVTLKGVQVTFGDSFFVGQCEVFVCLGFGHFILFVYFFLGCEAQKVREWGVNSLKTLIFPLPMAP